MKKILIAGSCAILLCFTSCATKQAPENDSQIAAPQAETAETKEEESSVINNQTGDEENSSEEADTSESLEDADNEVPLTSEDFPEPETIEEPEVITLEPVEETEASESEPAPEEVEKEDPPEITIVNSNEENESENQTEAEGSVTEAANTDADDADNVNAADDITTNDVVIASNQDSDGISGGIDITDDDDSDVNLSDIEKDITPSRSVTLKKFEYLDVTYPGTGWIYMGLTDNSKDIAYFGRKLGTKDTKFSLQARAAGTKIIHFYRNDPLTGQYLDDYIEVIITAENGSNKTHVEAPEYKLPVQKKEKPVIKIEEKQETEEAAEEKAQESKKEAAAVKAKESSKGADSLVTKKTSEPVKKSDSEKKTDTEKKSDTEKTTASTKASEPVESDTGKTNTSSTKASDPATLLQEAQLLYNEKEYSAALNKLNLFFEYSTDKGDEALYLKGQILEAKSDIRDIKGAIDAYTTLTKNYPASKLWDSANKRIIYLKRFYLEVR
jgi:outer membrane biosynthesis protein TonB